MKTIQLTVLMAGICFSTLDCEAQSGLFLTNGLIAYYPFNGNANDASGNGNNGTVYGATLAPDRFGNSNACYLFDGLSQKILAGIANIPTNAQDRTLSTWEKFAGNTNIAGTFIPGAWGADADNGDFGIMAQYATPPVHWLVQFWGGGQDVLSGATIDNNWHQIVAVYGSGVAELFIDGVLIVTGAKTPNTGFSPLCIGTGVESFAGGGTGFPGYVDDVRVYNRALSSNEVTELYGIESTQPLSVIKAVTLQDYNLNVGSNYQVQISADLVSWTNQGPVFTATSSYWLSTNYWLVPNWNQLFFRLLPQ